MIETQVSTLLGMVLIGVALRDVFHSLFHPSGASSVQRLVSRATWRAVRWLSASRPTLLVLAGPSALVAVIASWIALVATGWALLYWPRLPDGFLLATGLEPAGQDSLLTAFYLSLVTLATLGYGDIAPASGWLRLLAPLEAMVGFVLLTAAISWVLSIYPALARRRSLAHLLTLLREAQARTGVAVPSLSASAAERLCEGLTAQLISVRGDLTHLPITYYFHSPDERTALAAALPYLLHLAEQECQLPGAPAVRLQAAMLRGAIDDLSSVLGARFLRLPLAPTEQVLAAYARDHQRHLPVDAPRALP